MCNLDNDKLARPRGASPVNHWIFGVFFNEFLTFYHFFWGFRIQIRALYRIIRVYFSRLGWKIFHCATVLSQFCHVRKYLCHEYLMQTSWKNFKGSSSILKPKRKSISLELWRSFWSLNSYHTSFQNSFFLLSYSSSAGLMWFFLT